MSYPAVATQAIAAMLLACALSVLGRYYPRGYLQLWAGAWLAGAVSIAFSLALSVTGGSDGSATALNWASQVAGFAHAALLLAGAWSFHTETPDSSRRWGVALGAGLLFGTLATIASRLVADDTTIIAALLPAASAVATLGTGLLIHRANVNGPSLGARWMWWLLLAIGAHRAVIVLAATGRMAPLPDAVAALPLVDVLLMAALGIGTAIAMVEDEQVLYRAASERQLETERRARASGSSLVSALAAVPDLVAVVGVDGRLVAWNPAFEAFARLHGTTVPAVGVPVVEVLPQAAASEWGGRLAGLLAGRDQLFEASFELPDVAPEFFDVSARPMRDGTDIVGGVIVARDVTERRKLEQQLQQAQRLDTVGRLAGGIAHDFNNLLTAILSSASVARESLPADHEVQADLADVQLAGERATQLTRQLLAFARRQPVSQQPIELNDHVATMERMLSRLVGPDIALQVKLGEGLWYVRADGPQLEQVLVNVVVNARDAMPNGGRLTIRTSNRTLADGAVVLPRPMPAGDYVEIVVTDTGMGMDEETLAHVFEPFYTTKPVGQGTGLGLAMCYGIVRQHHGVIWIESAPGRGTTVFILLPRFAGPLPQKDERQRINTPVEVSSGTETILLVEDEPQVRAVAARALRSAGYRVLEATNGRDGVQVARRERDAIDLIVSDVVMPEMGGKEMVEIARQFLPSAAVLFVSGYTAGSFPNSGDDPAANVFLQKPFTPQELLARVRQVLDRHAAERESRNTITTG